MDSKKRIIKITEASFISLAKKMINEALDAASNEEQKYKVEYWYQYDENSEFDVLVVTAKSEAEAIQKAKTQGGKNTVTGNHEKPPKRASKFSAELL